MKKKLISKRPFKSPWVLLGLFSTVPSKNLTNEGVFAYCGAFARLVSGTIANFEQPFDLAFANPGKAFEMHVVSYHKNNETWSSRRFFGLVNQISVKLRDGAEGGGGGEQ